MPSRKPKGRPRRAVAGRGQRKKQPRRWQGLDPFEPDRPGRGIAIGLLGLVTGIVMLVLGAGQLRAMADASALPPLRMTVSSCESVDPPPPSHGRPTITCYGRGADGPSGVTAGRWHFDAPRPLRGGEVVEVRCTPGGDCRGDLSDWGAGGVGQLAFGLLSFGAGAYTGSRVLTHRYAPRHDDFFRRRSTVVATLVFFAAVPVLGIVAAVLV
ncbi:hypothetical protein [Kitasatospora sp. NPDC004531]